jgi:predicted metal-dependent phosphoesterase TrpH
VIAVVDLHIHSTISDGTLTPVEIVSEAVARGLYAISIADHDSVGGVAWAQEAAVGQLHVLPGVEVSTQFGDVEVHILGYMMDCRNQTLLEALNTIREGRVRRARSIVERLNSLGVRIDYETVTDTAGGGSVGRPHIAKTLVAEGYVRNQQEAFRRFLRRGGAAFVPREKMSPAHAIEIIRGAGGAAVLAHPGIVRDRRAVEHVLDLGVDGIEVYHTDHSRDVAQRLLSIAQQRRLVVTGGSDSHGPGGPIPVEVGSVAVPDSTADTLISWAQKRGGDLEAGG